jgi:hypothetical protein
MEFSDLVRSAGGTGAFVTIIAIAFSAAIAVALISLAVTVHANNA